MAKKLGNEKVFLLCTVIGLSAFTKFPRRCQCKSVQNYTLN